MIRRMTIWLDSTDFARYALVPEELLPSWTGTEPDEVMAAYVSAVRVAGRDVLTLGGEPLPVAWLAESLTFARWYAADDDTGLLPAVEEAKSADGWEDVLQVDLGGRYVLTDAADDGDRILGHLRDARGVRQPQGPEVLRVEVPSGRYLVQSLLVEPDPDTRFMLERLSPR